MKAGGEHWQWDPNIPFYLGVLPRHGAKGSDVKVCALLLLVPNYVTNKAVKWFRAQNSFPGHTVNAFEDETGNLVFDLPLTNKNVFFWWPDAEGNAPDPGSITAQLVRFSFDPKSEDLDLPEPEVLVSDDCEFPRIDDRFAMGKHRRCFFDLMDTSAGTDFPTIAPVMGGGHALYNSLGSFEYSCKKLIKYFPGPTHMVQEPVFINRPGDAVEGDGWLIALVNNYATMASELHIVDTRDFAKAQAIIYLPVRLRAGLHGNWVDAQDIDLSR